MPTRAAACVTGGSLSAVAIAAALFAIPAGAVAPQMQFLIVTGLTVPAAACFRAARAFMDEVDRLEYECDRIRAERELE
jgi:hypothetical protein